MPHAAHPGWAPTKNPETNQQALPTRLMRATVPAAHRQIHHKAQVRGSGHVRDDRTYFEAILAAVEEADSWLIAGPGGTKKDLEKYLEGHGEELKKKLVGVEPMDLPTEGELIRQARKLFELTTA